MAEQLPVKRVMQLHNRYLTGLGGEDVVVDQDMDVLEDAGIEVEQRIVITEAEDVSGLKAKFGAARAAVWSDQAYQATVTAIQEFKPDLVHVHNTFVRLSPSVFWACAEQGVPVVVTLHNYRYLCANGLLFRNGAPCELCIDGNPLSGAMYKCYRDSRVASLTVTAIGRLHTARGTWRDKVSGYICFSEFSKERFVRGGFPTEKGYVINQCVPDPGLGSVSRGGDFVFVGRMSREKGPDIVLDAWMMNPEGEARLHMVGDGPLFESLKVRSRADVVWHGRLERSEVTRLVASARYLVVGSRCYETGPLSVIEALAVGTPCIVPDLGSMPERIGFGTAGIVVEPVNPAALAWAMVQDGDWTGQSVAARGLWEKNHTVEEYSKRLLEIYGEVTGWSTSVDHLER